MRTVRRAVDEASLTRFTESFPPASVPVDTNPGNTCSSNPALAWCYQYTNNQGTSRYHADNAPPSTGGSLEAESSAVANAHLAGYREHFLPATIGPGRQIRARLWYKKTRGHAQTQLMDMFVELIATDGTVPVQWPVDAQQIRTVNWTSMVTPTYTVLPGITIDRIRLSFDIQNRASGGGAASPSYVWFDDVQLEEPAGILALSWQELIN
ncbi:MAG: hypothetical protein A2010_13005 [Nitrospirae bacterium GWD2_57_9]|nr:MAG: hypothetical protein A2010_13005 [Nitrospirae bacterium GWD2_57_9]